MRPVAYVVHGWGWFHSDAVNCEAKSIPKVLLKEAGQGRMGVVLVLNGCGSWNRASCPVRLTILHIMLAPRF